MARSLCRPWRADRLFGHSYASVRLGLKEAGRASMTLKRPKSTPVRTIDHSSTVKGERHAEGRSAALERVVAMAHEHLEMDVVYIAELTCAGQLYRAVAGEAGCFDID